MPDTITRGPFSFIYGNVRELKNVVERSIYRWGTPSAAIGELVLDPFDSPWAPAAKTSQSDPDSHLGFSEQVARYELMLLSQALDQNDQHQGKASDALGLTYHQFRSQLKKHGLIGKDKVG